MWSADKGLVVCGNQFQLTILNADNSIDSIDITVTWNKFPFNLHTSNEEIFRMHVMVKLVFAVI